MGGAGPLLLLAAGALMAVSGALLVSASLRRLRRVGAFGSLYWRSFRQFAGYRLRTLRPLGSGLLGVALIAVGLLALYLGVISFYGNRLYHPAG
ncbi:MAG: hypothetical protein QOK05_2387 [Chloroflexota bacterium]|jgi:hypothetical protein|nr:hypothetical protein [Chloroflexota bacterium]